MKPACILLALFLVFSCKKETRRPEAKPVVKDTLDHGYNELQGKKGESPISISDYNTDNPDIQIKRPAKSTLHTSLDTHLLFNIWTTDPDGPHADFEISDKDFYVVDYDGDGSMPYTLEGNGLTVYYNDFVQKGTIKSLTKDSLEILWEGTDESTHYVIFPH